jgi:hypothetical protein
MNDYSDSEDRSAAELLRFAIGFGGFGLAATGVVLTVPALAVFGGVVFLLTVASFGGCGMD